jgi:hypothetical protein
MPRERTIQEGSNIEQRVDRSVGVDISQRNPNAREDLTRSFESAGSSVVSQHAAEFSQELLRQRDDSRTVSALLAARSINQEDLNMEAAGQLVRTAEMFAGAGRAIESSGMLLSAAMVSMDETAIAFRESAPPHSLS